MEKGLSKKNSKGILIKKQRNATTQRYLHLQLIATMYIMTSYVSSQAVLDACGMFKRAYAGHSCTYMQFTNTTVTVTVVISGSEKLSIMSLTMQGECNKLSFSIQEQERKLNEATVHATELDCQFHEEANKFRLMEVFLHYAPYACRIVLHSK